MADTPADGARPGPHSLAEVLIDGEGGRDLTRGIRRSIQRRQLSGDTVELFVEGLKDVCLKYLRLIVGR